MEQFGPFHGDRQSARADGYPNSNAHGDGDAHGHEYTHTFTHPHGYTDFWAFADDDHHPDLDAHTDFHGDHDPHGDADAAADFHVAADADAAHHGYPLAFTDAVGADGNLNMNLPGCLIENAARFCLLGGNALGVFGFRASHHGAGNLAGDGGVVAQQG